VVRTRVISGVLLGLAAIVIIWYGGALYLGLNLLLGLLALNEFYRMQRALRPITLIGFVGLFGVLWAAWSWSAVAAIGMFAATILLAFAVTAFPAPRRDVTARLAVTLLGVAYLGLGFGFLLALRRYHEGSVFALHTFHTLHEGRELTLTVVFGTWASDTVSYFAGRLFGATPMVPRLSPHKTWEGFVGGVIGTLVVVEFISLYTFVSPLKALLLGAVIAVAAPLGDLFESLLKRDAEVKDAGHFFPGHGGILDRFDSLLFASVASYFVITSALHL
jgi:phosphatidate cytidylyltransferase